MNIKEIALKLQATDRFRLNVSELSAIEFAKALIAELAKQNELIAINEPNYHYEAMGCGLEDRGITDRYEAMEYGWNCAIERMFEQFPKDPLYTFPPTVEQIANETAEAIAKYCRNQDLHCLSAEIESGEWKEFKK